MSVYGLHNSIFTCIPSNRDIVRESIVSQRSSGRKKQQGRCEVKGTSDLRATNNALQLFNTNTNFGCIWPNSRGKIRGYNSATSIKLIIILS